MPVVDRSQPGWEDLPEVPRCGATGPNGQHCRRGKGHLNHHRSDSGFQWGPAESPQKVAKAPAQQRAPDDDSLESFWATVRGKEDS